MELKGDKTELAVRLACCVVAALILYYGLEKLLEKHPIPQVEPYRPWLADNKVQAIAVAAAVLFGASLALFPPEDGPAEGAAEPRYQRVEDRPA